MTWTDPRGDLRTLLNDDDAGNLVKAKRVFPSRDGRTDGSVTTFYTFEDRLASPAGPQTSASPPLRIFLESPSTQQSTEVAASGIMLVDPVRGEFSLMGLAPSGVVMTGSYYWQNWLDANLDLCLQQAALQVNVTTVDQVPDGLQLAALDLAASLAHRMAAQRWSYRKSAQWLLEDAPAQEQIAGLVDFHSEQAKQFLADGLAARASFYDLRMDRGRSPAFKLLARTPRPYTPNR